jgi:hypothetical protein
MPADVGRRSARAWLGPVLVAAGLALLVAAAMVVRSGAWTGTIGPRDVESHIFVGPIAPGGSVQQEFNGPGSYFGVVKVEVRRAGGAPGAGEIEFRLADLETGRVIREGRVPINPRAGGQVIVWEFAPLPAAISGEYELTAVVSRESAAGASFAASLQDPLEGKLRTNGLAAAGHIDLSLEFRRAAGGVDMVRALLQSGRGPGLGLVGLPLLGMLVALGLVWRWGAGGGGGRLRVLAPAVGAQGLALGLVLAAQGAVPSPETSSGFWAAYGAAAVVVPPGVLLGMALASRTWRERIGRRSGAARRRLDAAIERAARALGRVVVPGTMRRSTREQTGAWIAALARKSAPLARLAERKWIWPVGLGGILTLGFLLREERLLSGAATPWLAYGGGTDAYVFFRYSVLVAGAEDGLREVLRLVSGNLKTDSAYLLPFSGLFFRAFGVYPGVTYLAQVFVLVGSAVPVVMALGVRSITGSRVAGMVVGLLMAVSAVPVRMSPVMKSDNFGYLLFAVTVWLFFLALRSEGRRMPAAFGLSAALLAVGRNIGWPVPVVWWAGAYLAIGLWRMGRGPGFSMGGVARAGLPLAVVAAVFVGIESFWQAVGHTEFWYTTGGMAEMIAHNMESPVEDGLPGALGVFLGNLDVFAVGLVSQSLALTPAMAWVTGAAWLGMAAIWAGRRAWSGMLVAAVALAGMTAFFLNVLEDDRWQRWYPLAAADGSDLLERSLLLAALAALIPAMAITLPRVGLLLLGVLGYVAGVLLTFPEATIGNPRIAFVVTMVFIFGIGLLLGEIRRLVAGSGGSRTGGDIQAVVTVAVLALLVAAGAWQLTTVGRGVADRAGEAAAETRYLGWVGESVAGPAVVLTSDRADPWKTFAETGLPVIHDFRFSSAMWVDGLPVSVSEFENCGKPATVEGTRCPRMSELAAAAARGELRLIFYDPLHRVGVDRDLAELDEVMDGAFRYSGIPGLEGARLVRAADYPARPKWGLWEVRVGG